MKTLGLKFFTLSLLLLLGGWMVACQSLAPLPVDPDSVVMNQVTQVNLLPVHLKDGELLRVVASTNILGDVVVQVGGEAIQVIDLLPLGADPHSFVPTPKDLVALTDAHIIFVNGLGLEASLEIILRSLDGKIPVISVNAGVETLTFGAGAEDHDHGDADPHTWFRIRAVRQWVENMAQSLTALDPAHGALYAANAQAYQQELADLEVELAALAAQVPPAQRKLVTDHDSLAYLAADYGFQVVGTVIPTLSTSASPSATDLARLQDQIRQEVVTAIFVGNTVNPALAQQIARDTGVRVVPIYTGSLSPPDGPAPTYVDFMRHNMSTIVSELTRHP